MLAFLHFERNKQYFLTQIYLNQVFVFLKQIIIRFLETSWKTNIKTINKVGISYTTLCIKMIVLVRNIFKRFAGLKDF